MAEYFIWYRDVEDRVACMLDRPPLEGALAFRPRLGEEMGSLYTAPVELQMAPDIGGIKPTDLVHNTFGLCLVSERLRDLLEMEADATFEFLPFYIINHKGRLEESAYYIANLIGRQVDCVDRGRSEIKENRLREGLFRGIRRLVIDEAAVDPTFKIFRLKQMPKVLLVRADLREAMEHAHITGSEFLPLDTPIDVY